MTALGQLTSITVTRNDVEDFLYAEAAVLDEWRLDDWLALLTPDATYVIPSMDNRDGDPAASLTVLADGPHRIRARVKRLNSPKALREQPRGRTKRIISNVRIVARRDDAIDVVANFVVYRLRRGTYHQFIGTYKYELLVTVDGLRIRSRRVELDNETLDEQGSVAFIL